MADDTREKEMLLMCARRYVRLVELDAPQNILRKEFSMLLERTALRLPQLAPGPDDPTLTTH